MTSVAGDFYDFIQIDEHRIGILVADVSGHGMPAALISSMLKIALDGQTGCALEPARVLAEAESSVVVENSQEGTLCHCRVCSG